MKVFAVQATDDYDRQRGKPKWFSNYGDAYLHAKHKVAAGLKSNDFLVRQNRTITVPAVFQITEYSVPEPEIVELFEGMISATAPARMLGRYLEEVTKSGIVLGLEKVTRKDLKND